MSSIVKRNVREEFYSILTPKDCKKYSLSSKENYENAISRLEHTLSDIVGKLNNNEYTKHQPEIDETVLDYYNKVIDNFKTALTEFISTGTWSFKDPINSFSENTINLYTTFLKETTKYGSFFNGDPEIVNKLFEKVVKTLLKNNFSASDLSQKKAVEEEAKKPKIEVVSYQRFDTYDPERMKKYKTSGRGEQMALTSFLDKRRYQYYYGKSYIEKYPILKEYLDKVFNAFDNAWFSYVSGTTKDLDLSEASSIYQEYCEKYPVVKNFDYKVCSSRMAYGGAFTFYDCKEAMYKMAKSREKVVKAITMEKEDTYSLWEKSVDAILNDEGKPSLNAYLDKWVEDVVVYYTDTENIKRWKELDTQLVKEIEDLKDQMNEIALQWGKDHANDRNLTWRELHDGFKNLDNYRSLEGSMSLKVNVKRSNDKDLNIAKMGEEKIRKMFKEQAADAKKSFITVVCERTGVLKDGVFYWSVQDTGHLNGTVTGENGSKWRITSFFAGGYNIQKLHVRTKITELV